MAENDQETLSCEKHGFFVVGEKNGRRCPTCRNEDYEREEVEDRKREFSHARDRAQWAKIPLRYRGVTFREFTTETPEQCQILAIARNYAHNFPDHYWAGRCLVFCGRLGTGKTLLASIIMQTLVNFEWLFTKRDGSYGGYFFRARYATAIEVIRSVRDTWGTKATAASVIDEYVDRDLLVLDEVGANAGTDSERAQLFELLDLRYQAGRPSIIITNCDLNGLIHVLGERAVDRLRDHGGLVCVFDWPSWRSREYGKAGIDYEQQ